TERRAASTARSRIRREICARGRCRADRPRASIERSPYCRPRASRSLARALGLRVSDRVTLSGMGVATTLGIAVRGWRFSVKAATRGGLAALAILMATVGPAFAGERYALVVTGASGGPQYAKQYDAWRTSFVNLLRDSWNYPDDHVVVLAENEGDGVAQSTRENVRRVLADLRTQATKDDVLLVLLIGDGASANSDEAKFNLVGPDLSAAEWADLLRPIAARLVFVDTASGSFPFLERLSARGRIVITANDSAAQQFETVFPGF